MLSKPLARHLRLLAALGALAVAGCGFAPVYGDKGAVTPLVGQTAIETTETPLGYELAGRLVERLGAPTEDRFVLSVTPSITAQDTAIEGGDSATRSFLRGSASYVLTETAGAIVSSGQVQSTTGYSTTANTVATRAAEQDAHERLSIMLADLVLAQVITDLAR